MRLEKETEEKEEGGEEREGKKRVPLRRSEQYVRY